MKCAPVKDLTPSLRDGLQFGLCRPLDTPRFTRGYSRLLPPEEWKPDVSSPAGRPCRWTADTEPGVLCDLRLQVVNRRTASIHVHGCLRHLAFSTTLSARFGSLPGLRIRIWGTRFWLLARMGTCASRQRRMKARIFGDLGRKSVVIWLKPAQNALKFAGFGY
jgi:hypothetical protein